MIKGDNTDLEREDKPFSDRYDIAKFLADVKLRIRKDISTDFILAKLDSKDKEGIIEMTSNAYFAKKLIEITIRKGFKWKWDSEKYEKVALDRKDIIYLRMLGDTIFDSFMTRIYMTVILNRNVEQNYLINVLAGYNETEVEEPQRVKELGEIVKELTKNEENKNTKEK